jgi:ParB/RepB/Spo0J family partition protein
MTITNAEREDLVKVVHSKDGVQQIVLGEINVRPGRLRALRPQVIDELATSMRERGQLQPIVVSPRPDTGYWLIAGWHRLEAARKLKWPSMSAMIVDIADAAAAELIEIDENLVRAELSPAERAQHTARRKEVPKERVQQYRHPNKSRQKPKRNRRQFSPQR